MASKVHRRLLDMLAGWMQYVDKCAEDEEPHPGVSSAEYEAEATAIHDLYQAAGGLLVNRGDVPDDEALQFIVARVVPLLATGVGLNGSEADR